MALLDGAIAALLGAAGGRDGLRPGAELSALGVEGDVGHWLRVAVDVTKGDPCCHHVEQGDLCSERRHCSHPSSSSSSIWLPLAAT